METRKSPKTNDRVNAICYFFSRFNKYQFGDLFPGDRYTINMWAVSKGDEKTAVVRNYTFYDSTYPLEPTIATEVTVTEHTVHFGWTNPVYFSASYSHRPAYKLITT